MKDVRSYGGQARIYDAEYRDFVDDIHYYLGRMRALGAGYSVVELGVGTARVAGPLVEAGYSVVGLDISARMLKYAKKRSERLPENKRGQLTLLKRDITQFELKREFDTIIASFSMLALLTTREQRRYCLERCHRHLCSAGVLLIDLPHNEVEPNEGDLHVFSHQFRVPPYGHWVKKYTQQRFVGATQCWEISYRYEEWTGDELTMLDGFEVQFPFAHLTPEIVERELNDAGFYSETVFGDYRNNPLRTRSPRLLLDARKL